MDINELISDKQKEEEGVWFVLSATSEIKLARIGNPQYTAYMNKLLAPYKNHRMAQKDLPENLKIELSIKAIVETIIKDWKGFTENGEPFPYSKENALRLLNESRDFCDLVASLASEATEYRKSALDAASKN